jgi:hypothetical protein
MGRTEKWALSEPSEERLSSTMKIITLIAQQISPEALSAAGLLGDARAWISAEADDLFTAATAALATSA